MRLRLIQSRHPSQETHLEQAQNNPAPRSLTKAIRQSCGQFQRKDRRGGGGSLFLPVLLIVPSFEAGNLAINKNDFAFR